MSTGTLVFTTSILLQQFFFARSFFTESSPMIDPLKDINHFQKVFIELGSLSWPSGYEIHAETICREGEKINSLKDSSI